MQTYVVRYTYKLSYIYGTLTVF